ncbi:hypothetical protein [Burkholderia cepacia]|uniref:hypothetical protein n=1 Tax=Burkholderia cepacia TaxID=292 RepID=UPI002AB5E52E|nr:hypothetical protein [Burkholderia cepacia]
MAHPIISSPRTRGAALVRRFLRIAVVRPLVLLAFVFLFAAMIAGDGDPIRGTVRFVLETGATIQRTDIAGEYVVIGCFDTADVAMPAVDRSLACRHVGSTRVTLSSVAADVRFLLSIAYVLSVVASSLIADHLACLTGLFVLIRNRIHVGRGRELSTGEADV